MTLTTEFVTRFWSGVDYSPTDGCWLWKRGTDRKGYGAISFKGRMLKAHRVAFYLANGRWPLPCGLHACDTPACVRVGRDHVFEGTNAENHADKIRKGRQARNTGVRGERNSATKVTPETVRCIRRLHAGGARTVAIAGFSGLSVAQVRNITSGRHWGWLQ